MARQRNQPHASVHPDPHPDPELYDDEWDDPDPLKAPPAPPGYSFRWIRDMLPDGRPDAKRLLQAQRQGFTPVLPEEVDDPAYKSLAHEGRIRVDELVLMKISDQSRERLARPIRRATQAQQDAAKHNLFREVPRNQVFGPPEYQAKAGRSVKRGRVAIADD